MVEIEKNVPIPKKYGTSKYPFTEMVPGDSILIKGRSSVEALKKRLPGTSWAMSISGAPKGYTRVWRVS